MSIDKTLFERVVGEAARNRHDLHYFIVQTINHVLNSSGSGIDRVIWYTRKSGCIYTPTFRLEDIEDSASFVEVLLASCDRLQKKTGTFGNFVLVGKQGFDILKKLPLATFSFDGSEGLLNEHIRVCYVPSMEEDAFLVSVNEYIKFGSDEKYKRFHSVNSHMNDLVVGRIVDGECPKELAHKLIIADDVDHPKTETCNDHEQEESDSNRYCTHLIYGPSRCNRTDLFRQIVREKGDRGESVLLLCTEQYEMAHYGYQEDDKPYIHHLDEIVFSPRNTSPKELAERICSFYFSRVDRDSGGTVAIDDLSLFQLNPNYGSSEYFEELSKSCKTNNLNLLFTLCAESRKKDSFPTVPEVYQRFADMVTILK